MALLYSIVDRTVGLAVTRSSLKRKVCGWNLKEVKLDAKLLKCSPSLRHFFLRSCVAQAQWRGDGPRKLATRFGVIQRVQWKIRFDWLCLFKMPRFVYDVANILSKLRKSISGVVHWRWVFQRNYYTKQKYTSKELKNGNCRNNFLRSLFPINYYRSGLGYEINSCYIHRKWWFCHSHQGSSLQHSIVSFLVGLGCNIAMFLKLWQGNKKRNIKLCLKWSSIYLMWRWYMCVYTVWKCERFM